MSNKNKRLVMIVGFPGTGKTASLRDIEDQEGVLFLNCEAGKDIPFKNRFREEIITDPYDIFEHIADAEDDNKMHTVVIDSITMMMEMFESVHIVGAKDSRAEWGNYNQFFKELMQQYVAPSRLRFIMTAHVEEILDETTGTRKVVVPVKGALRKNGVEAFFSTIVGTTKVPLKKLKGYENDLLNITKREETLGFKHVFQTQTTKDTLGDNLRGPFDMFTIEETFIDNNAQNLLDVLDDFYEDA